MPLTRVTITGADDSVSPAALADFSSAYPFVEWGILLSTKRIGEPRYPSLSWRVRLGKLRKIPPLSLHLCGQSARDILAGDTDLMGALGEEYARVQVNGWVPSPTFRHLVCHEAREFILQVRGDEFLQPAADEAAAITAEMDPQFVNGTVSALWDCSGGRGLEPFSWPRPPLGLRLGYAGGITPDNVRDVLGAIGPVSHDFWIDMESGVRTDDRFDVAKVWRLLETVAPLVQVSGTISEREGA
jgi:hypothetical protein